jgi:hypothetical protein
LLTFNFRKYAFDKFKRLELQSHSFIRVPLECSSFLANLDKNAQGDAGAQSNPLANMHLGELFASCKYDSNTGMIKISKIHMIKHTISSLDCDGNPK